MTTPPPGTRCPVTGSAKAPRGRRPARRSRRGPRSTPVLVHLIDVGEHLVQLRQRRRPRHRGHVPAPEPADFSFHASCVQRREHSRHRPVSRSSAHGPCRSPGQDAFGCVLAGIPGAYTNSSTPGRGNTHRRAPATSAQSRCLLPTISNPLPISQRRHGIAVLRQRPSSLLPAPGPASRGPLGACRSGSTCCVRGGHPAAAGSSSAHHLRPAGQAFDPFLAEIAVHYSTLRQVTRDDVTGMARRSQTSGQ